MKNDELERLMAEGYEECAEMNAELAEEAMGAQAECLPEWDDEDKRQLGTGLEQLSRAARMLAAVDRADDALRIADVAEAARVYARKADLGAEVVNYATAIKVRALRRMAELVDAGQAAGEIATREDGTAIRDHVLSQDKVPATLAELGISRQRLHEARKLETLTDDAINDAVENANEAGEEVSAASLKRMAVHFSTGEDDWMTPAHIVTAAQEALEHITLDPCASSQNPYNVPTEYRFLEEHDGLLQEWFGRVYMNPPYGRGIGEWINKLVFHREHGDVEAFVALVPARTDTEWFERLISVQSIRLCFVRRRLRFGSSDVGAPFPSVAAWSGDDEDLFVRAFGRYGSIWSHL